MKKFKAMMKKLFSSKATTRVLSAFLSAVLLFYVIPTVVYGEVAGLFESEPSEESSSGTSYEYINEMHEVESLREESVKHFRLEDGSYVAAQYNYPVHYADEDGKWHDIDNTLESAIGGVYATSNARIKLAKKITGNETLFALKDGNTKLSFGLIGAAKGTVGTVINGEDSSSDTELQKMMNLEKLSSSVVYENILPGVDLEYVIDSLNIKENLIVKEKGNSYSYSFSMKLNGMYAELDEDGNVLIYNDDSGEIEYTIPAPVVFDSAYTHAPKDAASYTLDSSEKKYTLTVTVDAAWMNSEERVYPVTVDPTVSRENAYAYDTYITNVDGAKDSSYGDSTVLAVVTNSQAYWGVTSLPTLPKEAYISKATVSAYASFAGGVNIGVYEVTSTWYESLTWNQFLSGSGALGDLLDYNNVNNGRYYWNITPLVKEWNNKRIDSSAGKNNYGIAFKAVTSGSSSMNFYSSEHSSATYRPALEISYTVMRGVEDYWSYSSHSAGVAGSGSVNLANGKLTFAIPTISTTDSLMPYTPTLVYDSAIAGTYYLSSMAQTYVSGIQMGYGFKLNITESVIKKSYVNFLGTTVTYYVYTDADGTEHAMLQSAGDSSQFIDEDGLGLILTVNSNNTLSIADDSKTVRTFSKTSSNPSGTSGAWYLSTITDKSGNAVVFTYDTSTYKPTKVSIKPYGSSQIDFLELSYNSNGVLSMILNSTARQAVVFRYSQAYNGSISSTAYNYLRRIDFAYGSSSVTASNWSSFASSSSSTTNITVDSTALYTYNSSGLLLTATDNKANQKISYEWNAKKVSKISHYGGSTLGQSLSLTYGVNHTAVRTVGANGTANDSDDIITRSYFDSYGRVTSSYSISASGEMIYGATTGRYSDDSTSKNNITEKTVMGGTATNYLLNGLFNKTDSSGNPSCWSMSNASLNREQYGEPTRYIEILPGGAVSQDVTLTAGTYTISIPSYSVYVPLNCSAKIEVLNSSNVALNSGATDLIFEPIGEGFYSHTFTVSTTGTYTVKISFFEDTGYNSNPTFKLYGVMLEKNIGVSDITLVENGSFELSGAASSYWKSYSGNTALYPDFDEVGGEFGRVLYMATSGVSVTRYAKQNILTETVANALVDKGEYVISGFAKSTHAMPSANSTFRLRVDVSYYRSTTGATVVKSHYFDFDPYVTDWQFVGGSFNLKYDSTSGNTNERFYVTSIDVYCEYSGQPFNGVYFDNIYVYEVEDDTVNYEYYTDSTYGGLMKSMTKKTYSETYEYYENRNLKKVTGSNGTKTEYVYTTKNLVDYTIDYKQKKDESTGTSEWTITKTDYSYNSYGLCSYTETSALNTDLTRVQGSKTIYNSYSYNTKSGSKIFGAMTQEDDGIKTVIRYTYDDSNGNLLATINVRDKTGYCYTYDGMGRLTGVRPATYNASTGYNTVTNAENVAYTYNTNGYLSSITTDSTTYNFTYDVFGNSSSIKVGSTQIASYEYYPKNGNLKKITYGNGHAEEYKYNELDLLTEVWYNQGTSTELVYSYEYTSDGQLYKFIDHTTGNSIIYKYDLSNRVIGMIEYSGEDNEENVAHVYRYDDQGRLLTSDYTVSYTAPSTLTVGSVYLGYHYNADDTIHYVTFGSNDFMGRELFELDYYDRISSRTYEFLAEDTGTQYTIFDSEVNYTYVDDGTDTNAQVATYSSTVNGVTTTYTYTYDNKGNITNIQYSNGQEIRYYYDDIGQLIREDNELLGWTYTYDYDKAGNIMYSVSFELTPEEEEPLGAYVIKELDYTNTDWGDLLTMSFREPITYDSIGNPLTYYSDLEYTFSWNGRRLISATTGSNSLSFTYNDSGIRTSKTKNGVTTTYYLSGSQIIAEETNGNFTVYIYDADGSILGFQYRGADYFQNTWDTYFFEKNLQGDVVAIYDEDCNKLVSYTYDAWGNFTRTYTNGGQNTVAANNPFTYRGYYFDYDLKFYYLNSRYYDPYIGRFINADGYISTGLDLLACNMFAYCYNNPINYRDESGEFPWLIVSILTISTVVGAILGALSNKRLGEDSKSYDVVLGDTSHEESTELTTTDVVKNTIIGATTGLAVGGIAVGLLGAYGTLYLHSGFKVISWLGVSGVQAWAIGGLSTAVGKFIVEPLFNVLMPDVLEYPS